SPLLSTLFPYTTLFRSLHSPFCGHKNRERIPIAKSFFRKFIGKKSFPLIYRLLRSEIIFFGSIPIYYIPECINIIGAFVLVFQIVGVLPNIKADDRRAFYFCNVHQWIILIRG